MQVHSILATASSNNTLETSLIITHSGETKKEQATLSKRGFIHATVNSNGDCNHQLLSFSEFPFKEFSAWCQQEPLQKAEVALKKEEAAPQKQEEQEKAVQKQEDPQQKQEHVAAPLVMVASYGCMTTLEFALIQCILLAVVSEEDKETVQEMKKGSAFIFVKNGNEEPIFECHASACALHLKYKQGQGFTKHIHPKLDALGTHRSNTPQEVTLSTLVNHTITLRNTGLVPWPSNVTLVHYLDAKQHIVIHSVPDIPVLLPNETKDIVIGVEYQKAGIENLIVRLATPEGSMFGNEIQIHSKVVVPPTTTPIAPITLVDTPQDHSNVDIQRLLKDLLAPISALVVVSAAISNNLYF